jgi:hypothetical protein
MGSGTLAGEPSMNSNRFSRLSGLLLANKDNSDQISFLW